MLASQFPKNLVAEVLARLTVKSLMRFKCVSRSWKALIEDDKDFINLHMKSSKAEKDSNTVLLLTGAYGEIPRFYTVNLDLSAGMMKATEAHIQVRPGICISGIEGCCNGLLCLSDSKTGVFLSNPATRMNWQLPSPLRKTKNLNPSHECCVYGFGYDNVGDDYKVIRVVEDYINKGFGILKPILQEVQVYTKKSNSWRQLQQFPYFIGNRRSPTPGKLVNHALHWVMEDSDSDDDVIVAIDLRTEQYYTVPQPPINVERKESCTSSSSPWVLEVLEGCLCVMNRQDSTTLQLWIMKEYGVKDSWTKVVLKKFPSVVSPHPIPISHSSRRSDEIFLHDNRYVFSHDAEDQMLRKVVFFPSYIRSIGYPLINSLVQPWPSC